MVRHFLVLVFAVRGACFACSGAFLFFCPVSFFAFPDAFFVLLIGFFPGGLWFMFRCFFCCSGCCSSYSVFLSCLGWFLLLAMFFHFQVPLFCFWLCSSCCLFLSLSSYSCCSGCFLFISYCFFCASDCAGCKRCLSRVQKCVLKCCVLLGCLMYF